MNELPRLNQKTITKLLNQNFRNKILRKMNGKKSIQIKDYAKYVVDCQILQRMTIYENDSNSGWGFPQLNILCCFKKNGEFEKKFFEFNTINHFLKDKDGDSAIEVVACMLWLWSVEDKSIDSFDYERIDAELVKIDKDISEKQAKDKKIDDTGKRIYNIVKPIVEQTQNKSYDEVAEKTKSAIERMLEEFKQAGDIARYVVSLDRNTDETKKDGNFFADIGYKLEEKDDFTILACHVKPSLDGTISCKNYLVMHNDVYRWNI